MVARSCLGTTDRALPYFDQLLQRLEACDDCLGRRFGRHVHWGYWDQPRIDSAQAWAGFAEAAEALSLRLLHQARIRDGERVLDVGCGLGGTIACLNAGWQHLVLTGVNLDPRQIAVARRSVVARAGNSMAWLVADACDLPLPAASQDVVLAVECIFHFPARERFLAEVRRVLRPGGRLVLSDFVPVPPLAWLLRLLAAGRSAQVFNRTYGPVDCSWDCRRYARQARRHGLRLVGNDDITVNTLPTYGVVARLFEAMDLPTAVADTAAIERLSRWRWLRYRILQFALEDDGQPIWSEHPIPGRG